MATPAPVAPPPTTIISHGPACARRRWYISDLVIETKRPASGSLENHLQRELDLPRREGGANGPEGGIGSLRVRYAEIRVIQEVEELRPELQVGALAKVEVLVDRKVPLVEIGCAERIAADISVGRTGGRRAECVPGEKGVQHGRAALADGAAGHIGADEWLAAIIVGKGADNVGSGGIVDYVDGLARVGGVDAGDFPPAHKRIDNGIHVGAELAVLAEGKLVNDGGDIIQLHVKAGRSFFGGQVANVLWVGLVIAREILERLLGIAHAFPPGERVQDVQALRETVLDAGRETVVVVVTARIEPGDGSESRYRHARRDSQALARLVGSRLIVIGDDGEPRAVVTVIGQLEYRVLGELPLHREEPVLYARPFAVRRGVDRVGIDRIEGRGAGNVGAKAVQGCEEGRRRRIRLAEDAEQGLRGIDSLLGAAGPVEERVADSVSGADHRLGVDTVCQAKPRAEVSVVGVDQTAVEQTSAGGFDHGVGGGVEVRIVVIALIERGCELPPQADVQCQLGAHAEVVLKIHGVHELPQIDDRVAPQVDLVGGAEHEIREAVAGSVRRDRAAGRLAQLRTGGLAERSGVGILTINRIGVQNFGADVQVLVTHLDGMPANGLRVIKFRIPGRRVLELRITGLAAEGSESTDGLRVDSAGDAR